jgi:hypothetical protein
MPVSMTYFISVEEIVRQNMDRENIRVGRYFKLVSSTLAYSRQPGNYDKKHCKVANI